MDNAMFSLIWNCHADIKIRSCSILKCYHGFAHRVFFGNFISFKLGILFQFIFVCNYILVSVKLWLIVELHYGWKELQISYL